MKNLKITGPGIVTIIDKKRYVKEALMYIQQACPVCGGLYNHTYGDFQHYVGCRRKDLDKRTVKPDPPPSPPYPAAMGWICPRCGRGNAPHVSTCSCKSLEVTC